MRTKPFLGHRVQQGSVWLILVVLTAAILGAWQYSQHKAEQKRLAKEAAQRTQELAQRQAEEQRREAERKQLEKRLAEERQQRDALTTSNNAIDSLMARWVDATKVAGTTGRIALSGPVTTLQTLRRETEQLTVAPCMDQAKSLLVQSMGSTIEGYLVFMRNEMKIGDKLAQIDFDEAEKNMTAFRIARANCPK